jgi:nucleoside-diphosphate-sugar epimerase
VQRAIVTGGGGFIGFHLARHLAEQGLEVTILDDLSRGADDRLFRELISADNVVHINADLTANRFYSQLTGRYDYIYHLAAINGTKNFYEKPYEVLKVNILALINMLEWCSPENCGAFLFTSSSEAYAGTVNAFPAGHGHFMPTKEDIPLTVDDVLNPRYSYGGSKIAGELVTANYCRTRSLPFKIVRCHNIYGPRMGFDHVLPELIKRIHEKTDPFPLFGGEETRAFCEVSDGVRATEAVMLSDQCNGEIVNVGNSSEEIKIIDLLYKLLRLADFSPQIEIKAAPPGCVPRRCPDTAKLKTLTGYRASISLDEGLKTIFDWYIEAYASRQFPEIF